MTYVKPKCLPLLFLFAVLFSCKRDPVPPPGVDVSQARLTDFALEETTYTAITITHPVIRNGTETEPGTIRVVVPGGTSSQLTPKRNNFSNTGFTVLPQLGQAQNLLNRTTVYTIAANGNPAKAVHYAVTVAEEAGQTDGPPALTSFKFEKAKNNFLPADVVAEKIMEAPGTLGKVFIFVPAGTSFSALTPTIGFQGTGLFYTQDENSVPENSTVVYPAGGTPIDFTYPKVFYAVVRSGSTAKTYSVIVDVKNPIHFASADGTTADIPAGALKQLQVSTFRNQGNHPISIIRVDHSNHLPAGLSVVRGSGIIPSGGLLPGKSGEVFATVSAQTFPAGTYAVTASFQPRLVSHPEADALLAGSALRLTTRIIP